MPATPRRLSLALAILIAAGSVAAGTREDARADNAVRVLQQIQAIPESSIPDRLLEEAKGIVVVPDTLKAGFMLGGRRGQGREDDRPNGEAYCPTLARGVIVLAA